MVFMQFHVFDCVSFGFNAASFRPRFRGMLDVCFFQPDMSIPQ
jgi:hypothetical protein